MRAPVNASKPLLQAALAIDAHLTFLVGIKVYGGDVAITPQVHKSMHCFVALSRSALTPKRARVLTKT